MGVDHADDDAVAELFARVRDEHGGLDLLVANAFDGNALPFAGGPFWTLPLQHIPRTRRARAAAGPQVARHADRTIPVAELAEEYGFRDIGTDTVEPT